MNYKENYFFRPAFYWVSLSVFCLLYPFEPLLAQPNFNECLIIAPEESHLQEKGKTAGTTSNDSCKVNLQTWSGVQNSTLSDDKFVEIELNPGEESNCLKLNKFGFNIPEGSTIQGLQLIIEGHMEGEGNSVKGTYLRLLNKNGNPTGSNKYRSVFLGSAWQNTQNGSDVKWVYGHENDDWNTLLSPDLVNNMNFGLLLRVKNYGNQTSKVRIDRIQVKLHYTPVYTVCNHDCITFFVADHYNDVSVEWAMPVGFSVLSGTEVNNTINIAAIGDQKGLHQICADVTNKNGITTRCCKQFILDDCRPGSIGDFVWNDLNGNGLQDVDEPGLPDVSINLFDDSDVLLQSTLSDDDGIYLFDSLQKGGYYLQTILPEGFIATLFDPLTDTDIDNDISNFKGPGTTDEIQLEPAEIRNDIDLGFVDQSSDVKGSVWCDIDRNGLKNEGEDLIPGLLVRLFSSSSVLLDSAFTDDDGKYIFNQVDTGQYYLEFMLVQDKEFTIPNVNASSTDSDVTGSNGPGTTNIFEITPGGSSIILDAGLAFLKSEIRGTAWLDSNSDGLLSSDENGIEQIRVKLWSEEGELLDSIFTNEDGSYIFSDLEITFYYLEFDQLPGFDFTQSGVLPDDLNSDVSDMNGPGTTDLFFLQGGIPQSKNAGYVDITSDIEGITWCDSNRNGILDESEEGLPNVGIILYAEDGTQLMTTESDELGNFIFSQISTDSYYLVFEEMNAKIFSPANGGTGSETDSDITENLEIGSTDVFTISSGGNSVNINAGYMPIMGMIQGIVWQDFNNDGIRTINEFSVNNLDVQLRNMEGTVLQTRSTNEDGFYEFSELLAGMYYIVFQIEENQKFSPADIGDDFTDSDATESNGPGSTDFVFIDAEGQTILLDAGITNREGGVSGEVWQDTNENGTQDSDEVNIPGITVSLYGQNMNFIEENVTDDQGKYGFTNVSIGLYYLVFSLPELSKFTISKQGGNIELDSDITSAVASGSTDIFEIEEDFTLMNIDAGIIDISSNISGVSWLDNNGDGVLSDQEEGLEGLVVDLYSAESVLLESDTTNLIGEYFFGPLDTGNYYLVFNKSDDKQFTFPDIGLEDFDSDVTGIIQEGSTDILVIEEGTKLNNINAGLFELASIAGEVWQDLNDNAIQDTSDSLVVNISISLFTNTGGLVNEIVSDNEGKYLFDGLKPGTYFVQYTLPENYFFIEFNSEPDNEQNSDVENINGALGSTYELQLFSAAQLSQIDAGIFEMLPETSTIGDLVWHDLNGNGLKDPNEPGLNEVMVILFDSLDQMVDLTMSQTNQETGAKGFYRFEDVPPGSYYLQFIGPIGFNFSPPNISDNEVVDSDVTLANGEGTTDLFSVEAQKNNLNIDAGLYQNVKIGDFVWRDGNFNGVQDEFEEGINDVFVRLFDDDDNLVATTMTVFDDSIGQNGKFAFDINPGTYYIKFELAEGLFFTEPNSGDNDAIDSDVNSANGFSSTNSFSIFSGETNNTIDAGMLEEPGSIGDQLWLDINANGVFEPNEPGINDIKVRLFRNDNIAVDSTFTAQNPTSDLGGFYLFKNVPAGSYYVEFVLPEEYLTSPSNLGGNDATDSDIINVLGRGTTPFNTISPGEKDTDIDGGVYLPAQLGDFVWLDENGNGLQDIGEPGVENIEVTLFSAGNFPIETIITDETGVYSFNNLTQGLYFIKFEIPDNLQFTLPKQGTNDEIDSDVFSNGNSPLISLAHAVEFNDLDAGLIAASNLIGGNVWHDINGDGMQTRGEEKMIGVLVELHSENKSMIAITETDVVGDYIFTDLPEGSYFVKFILPEKFSFTDQNVGTNEKLDSDADSLGWVDMMYVSSKEFHKYIDAGVHSGSYFRANVWYDGNADGIQTFNEIGVDNVRVDLRNTDDELIQSIITRITGQNNQTQVEFEDVKPGIYKMVFQPADDELVATDEMINEGGYWDSDVVKIDNVFETRQIQVNSGESNFILGAGFYRGAKIGDKVWLDLDHNGAQNVYEPGMSEIKVQLYSMYGEMVEEIATSEYGTFKLKSIPKGMYYLKYNIHPKFIFSDAHMSPDSVDSDVTHEMGYGTTSLFELVPEAENYNMDAGVKAGVLAISEQEFFGEHFEFFNRLYLTPSNQSFVADYRFEKSLDGINFEIFVALKKDNRELYSIDDNNIHEVDKYYYRVKEIDENGEVMSISPVITILGRQNRNSNFRVFPNPAIDYVWINTGPIETELKCKLYDPTGKLVLTETIKPSGDLENYKLSINTLPASSYILTISFEAGVFVKKLIKHQ